MRIHFLLLVFFFLYNMGLYGQSLMDTIQIREVSVLAKKRVQETGIITTKPDSIAFKSTQTLDISELISKYTPIFVKSYGQGATATASFRGTGASHTQVTWNGMNLNSPMRGSVDLSQLPVFFIDEAVIYHGGSSMVQGSGGLGGSISLQNKPSWDSKMLLAGLIEIASFQTNKYFFNFQIGNKKFRSNTRVYYESSENDFPFYNYGMLPHKPDTQRNAAYWKAGFMQEYYFRPVDNQLLTLRLWYQQGKRGLPPLMSYEGEEREEYQNDNTLKAQFSWKNYDSNWNPQFFSGFTFSQLEYYRNSPGFNFVIDDSKSRENSFVNQFKINHKFSKKILLSMGVDLNYHQVNIVNNADLSGYIKERLEGSLMFDLHLKSRKDFAVVFLIRPEFYDNNLIFFTPLIGLEWAPSVKSPFLFQANVSRNFHKPNLNDMYWLPGGNPDLQPEDGYTGDLTFSFNKTNKQIEYMNKVTLFAAKIENWILWQPASNGAYYWEANNVKEVFSRGAEYQGNMSFKLGKSKLSVNGNYAYTRSSNLNAQNSVGQSRGKQLIYIPKHTGNLFLNYSLKGFSANYSINYTGKRYTTSSNEYNDFEQILTPCWLHSISVQKIFHLNDNEISIKGNINNLLDISYQSILWRAMPGRNYSITIGFNHKK